MLIDSYWFIRLREKYLAKNKYFSPQSWRSESRNCICVCVYFCRVYKVPISLVRLLLLRIKAFITHVVSLIELSSTGPWLVSGLCVGKSVRTLAITTSSRELTNGGELKLKIFVCYIVCVYAEAKWKESLKSGTVLLGKQVPLNCEHTAASKAK